MSELPTVAPGQTNVNVPHKHKGGTYLRRHLGVGAHKGDRHAARLLKSHAIAFLGEFVGTTLFCFFAFAGTTVASLPATSVTDSGATATQGAVQPSPNTSSLLYVALSFGFSLAVNIQIFAGVSGGVFNPAISLGLALIGAHTPVRAIILTIAQVLGSIAGAGITSGLLPGPLNVRTTLVAGTSVVRGLFIEMFLTCLLMLTVLVLTVEKSAIGAEAGSTAPVCIGLALFLGELVGVFYTGGSLNPARSIGPDIVIGTFDFYHWIYWLGPAMGACLAVAFWKLIRYVHFELGPRASGTPDASKMLLDGGGGGAPADTHEKGPSNNAGLDLGRTTSTASDNRSVMSVVVAPAPEPEDRIAQLETSNQRIEAMLRALTSGHDVGAHSPGTTAAGSLSASGHRKSSTDQLHGTDHLYSVPTTGSSHY